MIYYKVALMSVAHLTSTFTKHWLLQQNTMQLKDNRKKRTIYFLTNTVVTLLAKRIASVGQRLTVIYIHVCSSHDFISVFNSTIYDFTI